MIYTAKALTTWEFDSLLRQAGPNAEPDLTVAWDHYQETGFLDLFPAWVRFEDYQWQVLRPWADNLPPDVPVQLEPEDWEPLIVQAIEESGVIGLEWAEYGPDGDEGFFIVHGWKTLYHLQLVASNIAYPEHTNRIEAICFDRGMLQRRHDPYTILSEGKVDPNKFEGCGLAWPNLSECVPSLRDVEDALGDWGFSDEYTMCTECYRNTIQTSPDHMGWKPDYIVTDGAIICRECCQADPAETLELSDENPGLPPSDYAEPEDVWEWGWRVCVVDETDVAKVRAKSDKIVVEPASRYYNSYRCGPAYRAKKVWYQRLDRI